MAQLITPTETRNLKPANGQVFTLEEMQKLVGGYVERIVLEHGLVLFVNEDGRSCRLDNNYGATNLLRKYRGNDCVVILGNAVVCKPAEFC